MDQLSEAEDSAAEAHRALKVADSELRKSREEAATLKTEVPARASFG